MANVGSDHGSYDLADGYRLVKVVGGLSYPTNIEFGDAGELFVTEAGFTYPFVYKKARVLRLAQDDKQVVAEGFNGPLIGLKLHAGAFFVTHRGCLSRVDLNGTRTDLVTGIPAAGDHHTNHIVVANDKIYFGQGSATNSGVVGNDNLTLFGWLATHPDFHDVPGRDVVLSGKNYDGFMLRSVRRGETGPYKPLGTSAHAGELIEGQLKSNGVVYRCNLDGSELEVFAWGLRNPYGLASRPEDERIFVLDQGADRRGSRPAESPDALYELRQDAWYGWPDFLAGKPITDYDEKADFVLKDHPHAELPLHTFTTHSSAVTLDFSTNARFGYPGQAFVAQYGTEAPFTTRGKPVTGGRAIVRLDPVTWTEHPFFQSTTVAGIGKGPNRPVLAKFAPDGESLYLVDHGVRTLPKSGGIWQITPE